MSSASCSSRRAWMEATPRRQLEARTVRFNTPSGYDSSTASMSSMRQPDTTVVKLDPFFPGLMRGHYTQGYPQSQHSPGFFPVGLWTVRPISTHFLVVQESVQPHGKVY